MKKLLMILLAAGLVTGASAQYHGHVGGFYGGGVRSTVIVGGGFYGPYYGYPGFYWGLGYPFPYTYPYGYPYGHVPTKLERQISDIKADYADRITSVKADETLSGKEKRHQVRELKKDRDNAVANAVRSYWRTPLPNANPQNGTNPQSGENPKGGVTSQGETTSQAGETSQGDSAQ